MKDRFEVRFTVATDSLISEKTVNVVAKTIEKISKRYVDKIDRLVEALTKELEEDRDKKKKSEEK